MAKHIRNIYKNGVEIRLHNKRFGFKETEGKIICDFYFADSEPNQPAVLHDCIRGKVRVTKICMSVDAMQHLVSAYIAFIKFKATLPK